MPRHVAIVAAALMAACGVYLFLSIFCPEFATTCAAVYVGLIATAALYLRSHRGGWWTG